MTILSLINLSLLAILQIDSTKVENFNFIIGLFGFILLVIILIYILITSREE
jgi:hypothetical protein